MATETGTRINVDENTLAKGNRVCLQSVKRAIPEFLWITKNLPNDQRSALNSLLNYMIRAADYLDLESSNGLPLDVWCEFRDELSESFLGSYASVDLVPLVDSCRKYNVPKQYLFDMLDGVDGWIRQRRFDTFEQLEVFAYRFGGAALTAAVPIVGFVKPGYEQAAIAAGQSIFLTHLLANLVPDFKVKKIFVARQDIEDTELSISHVKVRKLCPGLKHLVRLYGSRIEKLMFKGGQLYPFLDFDARRCFKSLMAVHWAMLMKMRVDPPIVLEPDGILTKREMFGFRTRHILGLESSLPMIPEDDHVDH